MALVSGVLGSPSPGIPMFLVADVPLNEKTAGTKCPVYWYSSTRRHLTASFVGQTNIVVSGSVCSTLNVRYYVFLTFDANLDPEIVSFDFLVVFHYK